MKSQRARTATFYPHIHFLRVAFYCALSGTAGCGDVLKVLQGSGAESISRNWDYQRKFNLDPNSTGCRPEEANAKRKIKLTTFIVRTPASVGLVELEVST
jgi:hypothetical protein